jgi:hypothetical protein
MKNKYLIIPVIYLFSWTLVYANKNLESPFEETMCYSHEEIYFSCPVGEKIVSVCASGNISPKNGYVKYRFGHPGKPEFQFPEKSDPPMNKFSVSDFHGGNISSIHLKFKVGKYTYVVYQSATSGVYVTRNGRTVRNLLCDGGHYRQISPRAMRGIKTVEPDDNDD